MLSQSNPIQLSLSCYLIKIDVLFEQIDDGPIKLDRIICTKIRALRHLMSGNKFVI